MGKKKITEDVSDISIYDFEGNLDKVIENLQVLSARIKDMGFSDVKVTWEYGSGVEIEGTREETDKEYNKRIRREAKEKRKNDALKKAQRDKKILQELATLERLEKKYRKSNITQSPVGDGKSFDIS